MAFYTYGALLLGVLFHFLPIAIAARLAQSVGGAWRWVLIGLVCLAVSLSEDLGYFMGSSPRQAAETARHLISIAANATEVLFIFRFGFLAGLAQRATTYAVWHILWPAIRE